MIQEPILLHSFTDPMDANLLRIKLELNGLQCFIENEHTVMANWMYSNAIGGVKVYVPQKDFETAHQLVFQDDQKYVLNKEDLSEDKSAIQCPKCTSINIRQEKYHNISKGLFWIFHIPTFFKKKTHHCNECKYSWK